MFRGPFAAVAAVVFVVVALLVAVSLLKGVDRSREAYDFVQTELMMRRGIVYSMSAFDNPDTKVSRSEDGTYRVTALVTLMDPDSTGPPQPTTPEFGMTAQVELVKKGYFSSGGWRLLELDLGDY